MKIGADAPVSASAVQPALVWTGTDYSLVYSDPTGGNSDIYFRKIGPTGAVGTERHISFALGTSLAPSVAWTGSGHGVVWQDDRDGNVEIYFARLGASGAKIGADVRVTNAAGSSTWPRIVWTGQEFAVAWIDQTQRSAAALFPQARSFRESDRRRGAGFVHTRHPVQ